MLAYEAKSGRWWDIGHELLSVRSKPYEAKEEANYEEGFETGRFLRREFSQRAQVIYRSHGLQHGKCGGQSVCPEKHPGDHDGQKHEPLTRKPSYLAWRRPPP